MLCVAWYLAQSSSQGPGAAGPTDDLPDETLFPGNFLKYVCVCGTARRCGACGYEVNDTHTVHDDYAVHGVHVVHVVDSPHAL